MIIYRYVTEILLDPGNKDSKQNIVEYYIPDVKLAFNFIGFLNIFESQEPRSKVHEDVEVPDNLAVVMMDIYTKILVINQYLLDNLKDKHERKKEDQQGEDTEDGEDDGK